VIEKVQEEVIDLIQLVVLDQLVVLIYHKKVDQCNFRIVKILMLLVVVVEWMILTFHHRHQEEVIVIIVRMMRMLKVDTNKIHVMDLGKMETLIMMDDKEEEEVVDNNNNNNNLHHIHKILVLEINTAVEKDKEDHHKVNSLMDVTMMKIMISIHEMVMLLIIVVPVVNEVVQM
jgi:hypothetical protein